MYLLSVYDRIAANSAEILSEKKVSSAWVKQSLIRSNINKEVAESIVSKYALVTADGVETGSNIILNESIIKTIASEYALNEEELRRILLSDKVTSNNIKEAGSYQVLSNSILGLREKFDTLLSKGKLFISQIGSIAKTVTSSSVGASATVLGVVGAIGIAAFTLEKILKNNWEKRLTESVKSLSDLDEQFSSNKETLQSNIDKINEAKECYYQLSEGVNKLNNTNIS